MHYCSLLHEEQSRTRVQHKLQQQNTNVLWLHLLLPLLLRLWWRRLRFLLTEVWREDEGKKKPTTAATASKGRQLFVLRGSKHFAEALIAFLSLGFRKFHKSSSLTIEELQCSLASSYGGHSNRSSKVQKNESNFLMMMMKAQSSIITLTRLKRGLLTEYSFDWSSKTISSRCEATFCVLLMHVCVCVSQLLLLLRLSQFVTLALDRAGMTINSFLGSSIYLLKKVLHSNQSKDHQTSILKSSSKGGNLN